MALATQPNIVRHLQKQKQIESMVDNKISEARLKNQAGIGC